MEDQKYTIEDIKKVTKNFLFKSASPVPFLRIYKYLVSYYKLLKKEKEVFYGKLHTILTLNEIFVLTSPKEQGHWSLSCFFSKDQKKQLRNKISAYIKKVKPVSDTDNESDKELDNKDDNTSIKV